MRLLHGENKLHLISRKESSDLNTRNKWNTKRKMFIPDMYPPKKYTCKVCGSDIIPNKESRYVVKERLCNGGLGNALSGTYSEPKEYDAFDCKVCGCQFVAKERLKAVESHE